MTLRALALAALGLVLGPATEASADCRPCAKTTKVTEGGAVLFGLKAMPAKRARALRATIRKDYRSRARQKRGYRLTTSEVDAAGRVTLGTTPLDVLAARIELERKDDASDVEGHDELWIFVGGRSTSQTAVVRYGSPGISGSTGHAAFFPCGEGKALCALLWETCDAAPCLEAVRIIRVDAHGKVTAAGTLDEAAAAAVSSGAEVSFSRCGAKTYASFLTTPMDSGEKPQRLCRALSDKGFGKEPR
jgi:hypothetical protein